MSNLSRISRTFTLTALGLAWLAAPAHARLPAEPPTAAAQGVTITQAQCAAIQQAVWVVVMGRGLCMRYYISTAGGQGSQPVVFLQGDQPLRRERRPDGTFEPERVFDPVRLQRFADAFSRASRTTAIYLGRMGVDGSSGNHSQRRTVLELLATNAALDAIRQRHGYVGFHLVGQSGGSTLIGSLLHMRLDIGCAVPGAGRLALLRDQPTQRDPALRIIDGAIGIQWIARNSRARIMVVTDPRDRRVPWANQVTFVEQLRRAGGRVEHYLIEATDSHHHGTVAYTRAVVAACLRGASEADITTELAALVAQRVATRDRERPSAGGQPAPPRQDRPRRQPQPNAQPAPQPYPPQYGQPAPQQYPPQQGQPAPRPQAQPYPQPYVHPTAQPRPQTYGQPAPQPYPPQYGQPAPQPYPPQFVQPTPPPYVPPVS